MLTRRPRLILSAPFVLVAWALHLLAAFMASTAKLVAGPQWPTEEELNDP